MGLEIRFRRSLYVPTNHLHELVSLHEGLLKGCLEKYLHHGLQRCDLIRVRRGDLIVREIFAGFRDLSAGRPGKCILLHELRKSGGVLVVKGLRLSGMFLHGILRCPLDFEKALHFL